LQIGGTSKKRGENILGARTDFKGNKTEKRADLWARPGGNRADFRKAGKPRLTRAKFSRREGEMYGLTTGCLKKDRREFSMTPWEKPAGGKSCLAAL